MNLYMVKNLILGYENIIFHPNSEFEVDKLLKNLGHTIPLMK